MARILQIVCASALATLPSGWLRSDPSNRVAFPSQYRKWTHVKSAIVGPASPLFAAEGGIHHIYANGEAIRGLESGVFADGSMLVYDLLSTEETNGVSSERGRRRVDVMVKDRRFYPGSGGWGFERFLGDDRSHGTLTEEQRSACIACHSRKDHDLVFSRFRP
jgi:hypothetical protein